MNHRRRARFVLSCGAVIVFGASSAQALDPGTTDARQIAQAVEDRDAGDRIVSKATLTVTDASGRKRERKIAQQALEFEGGTKTVLFFEAPADVRDTGLLSIDYDDGTKDDDQWLYLPSLHKATRIATADRSGSFMGTDISYSDMTAKDTKAYDYKIIEQSAKVDNRDCWLIESRPKTDKEKKETGYVKTHIWVDKERVMPLQIKAWVTEGKKLKYMKFGAFEKIDGIWIARRIAVRSVRNGKVDSETLMQIESIKLNQETVTENQFSVRRLEQGL